MGLYDDLKADVDQLLADLGQDMVLLRPKAGATQDLVLGRVGAAADATFPAKGLVAEYAAKDVDGTIIQVGDKNVLLQAVEPPRPGDRLSVAGSAWSIVAWKEVNPGGVSIIYELQVRR